MINMSAVGGFCNPHTLATFGGGGPGSMKHYVYDALTGEGIAGVQIHFRALPASILPWSSTTTYVATDYFYYRDKVYTGCTGGVSSPLGKTPCRLRGDLLLAAVVNTDSSGAYTVALPEGIYFYEAYKDGYINDIGTVYLCKKKDNVVYNDFIFLCSPFSAGRFYTIVKIDHDADIAYYPVMRECRDVTAQDAYDTVGYSHTTSQSVPVITTYHAYIDTSVYRPHHDIYDNFVVSTINSSITYPNTLQMHFDTDKRYCVFYGEFPNLAEYIPQSTPGSAYFWFKIDVASTADNDNFYKSTTTSYSVTPDGSYHASTGGSYSLALGTFQYLNVNPFTKSYYSTSPITASISFHGLDDPIKTSISSGNVAEYPAYNDIYYSTLTLASQHYRSAIHHEELVTQGTPCLLKTCRGRYTNTVDYSTWNDSSFLVVDSYGRLWATAQ